MHFAAYYFKSLTQTTRGGQWYPSTICCTSHDHALCFLKSNRWISLLSVIPSLPFYHKQPSPNGSFMFLTSCGHLHHTTGRLSLSLPTTTTPAAAATTTSRQWHHSQQHFGQQQKRRQQTNFLHRHTSSNSNRQHTMASIPQLKSGNTNSQHTWVYMIHSAEQSRDAQKYTIPTVTSTEAELRAAYKDDSEARHTMDKLKH